MTIVFQILSRLFTSAVLALAVSVAQAQPAPKTLPPPTVRPAIDGILAAFRAHPLVALGDAHGLAQEEDFYAALVRDPRFAREVGNVVVEFGGAAHQDTLDRYLNGEDVSFAELRWVWTDVVGFDFPTAIGYVNFFASVRLVNLRLPPTQRIHVWLGEPPVDWSRIKKLADFAPLGLQRDSHAAAVIEKQILGKNKKAVVIYGGGHFYPSFALVKLVERKHPGAFFVVNVYTGYETKSCTGAFERSTRNWPTPALASVRGTALARDIRRPGCEVLPKPSWTFGPKITGAQKAQIIEEMLLNLSGANGDALLFLGNAASLTQSPIEPSVYLDTAYIAELNRRQKIMGNPQLPASIVQANPVSPRHIRK